MSLLFFSPTRPQRSKSSEIRSSKSRIFQQRQRFGAFFVAEFDFRFRRLQRLADLLRLQPLQSEKHLAHILADDVFLQPQLFGGAFDEGGALTVGLQVERIDVKLLLPRDQHVHLHDFGTEIFLKAPDAITAVVARDGDLIAVDADLRFGG